MERRARALNNLRNLPDSVTKLRQEAQGLSDAFALAVVHASIETPKSRLQPNRRLRDATLATIAVMLTTALVQWSWKALFEEMIFSALAWPRQPGHQASTH